MVSSGKSRGVADERRRPTASRRRAPAGSVNASVTVEVLPAQCRHSVAAQFRDDLPVVDERNRDHRWRATSARVDPAWQIAGTGDYNGDGHADILWRHTFRDDLHVVDERDPDHRWRASRHDPSRLADRRVGGLQRRRSRRHPVAAQFRDHLYVVDERNPDPRWGTSRHDRSRLADCRVGGLQRRRPRRHPVAAHVPGRPTCG